MTQYTFVYCRGHRVLARYLGEGWYVCRCGHKFRSVCPDDTELADAA